MAAGWWGLGGGIVAMVAVGVHAHAAGRLREYLIWAGIPLAVLPTIFLFPPHAAGRFLLMGAFLVSGLVVLLVVPQFPVLSGRARAAPRWGGAARVDRTLGLGRRASPLGGLPPQARR